jgi:3-hydroxy-9,10-secoandrosta-1,3,5(10)-triene-9,17-dione monooxygenase reductase component
MAEIDGARFRQVLGHFPTGVTVITGSEDDTPHGMTIGSFTSVSLDPPLVGFLPQQTSESWQAIARTGKFCVNVLGSTQGDECWKFAKSAPGGKFETFTWSHSALGSPILDGVLAWIDCTVEAVHEMGDHLFVLGAVHDLGVTEAEDPNALLFFRGKLGQFDRFPPP